MNETKLLVSSWYESRTQSGKWSKVKRYYNETIRTLEEHNWATSDDNAKFFEARRYFKYDYLHNVNYCARWVSIVWGSNNNERLVEVAQLLD